MAFMIKCWHCHEKWPNICIPSHRVILQSIHIFPPPPLFTCVCLLFLRHNNIAWCSPNATHVQKLKAQKLIVMMFVAVALRGMDRTADCSLLIENDENTEHNAKNGLKITSHYASPAVTIIIIAAWPTTLLLTFLPAIENPLHAYATHQLQMTNSIGQQEKLPLIRLRCVRASVHVCGANAFGLPGKIRHQSLSHIFLGDGVWPQNSISKYEVSVVVWSALSSVSPLWFAH